MNTKARNEFLKVVSGLILITVGMGYFISKSTVVSTFVSMDGIWKWWSVLLVFVPIIVGIVMLIIKPQWLASKIVAALGAIFLIVVIMRNTTIILTEKLAAIEWIAIIGFILAGVVLCFWGLFVRIRK